jgi:hypothetical protein
VICYTSLVRAQPLCYPSEMPRRDLNQIAFDVVRQATGQAVKPTPSPKAISGRKGGTARGVALTPEKRKAAAVSAAHARWSKKRP